MARFFVSPLAEQDIESISDYIAQDNPHRAITFVTELRSQCTKIASTPKAFWFYPDSTDT